MEQDTFVEKFADKVHRLGLEVPALLFLELHRPFSALFYNSALFAQPFVSPFLGGERTEQILEFLSQENSVQKLIETIEERRAGTAPENNQGQ